MGTATPVFAHLTTDECNAVLRRNHVGRLAFVADGIVDIEPVHFVAVDSWVFMRSAGGTKLEAFAHSPYVAFEVDEVDATFDWRSVVAHGTIYFMEPEGGDREREAYARGLELLRALDERILTSADRAPDRTTLFRIHVDDVVGRGASTQP